MKPVLTKEIENGLLNNDDHNNNNKLVQQSSMCSEPAATIGQLNTANVCPCSISYPNFQLNNLDDQQQMHKTTITTTTNQPITTTSSAIHVEKESSSTSSSGRNLLKSLRNKLRFSGESSFDEQNIALNEFSIEEPNNSAIKSNDQTNLIKNALNLSTSNSSSSNIGQLNDNVLQQQQNNAQNNGKCNTIFLSCLNEKDLTLEMDNV
jgi:hypothetical protein